MNQKTIQVRCSEEMKMWLFDLAHENLTSNEIVKGFLKHYVLFGLNLQNVADDIHFKTNYGDDAVMVAMELLKDALEQFTTP